MINIVATRMRQARNVLGISQRTLGIQAGIDPSSAGVRINQYEQGVHTPDVATLTQIGGVLKLPVAYFYATDDGLAELIALHSAMNTKEQAALLRTMRTTCT